MLVVALVPAVLPAGLPSSARAESLVVGGLYTTSSAVNKSLMVLACTSTWKGMVLSNTVCAIALVGMALQL